MINISIFKDAPIVPEERSRISCKFGSKYFSSKNSIYFDSCSYCQSDLRFRESKSHSCCWEYFEQFNNIHFYYDIFLRRNDATEFY